MSRMKWRSDMKEELIPILRRDSNGAYSKRDIENCKAVLRRMGRDDELLPVETEDGIALICSCCLSGRDDA